MKKIIAIEGLIIIGVAIVLYFIMFFCKTAPVVYPKYKAQFDGGKEYAVVVYPEINYKEAFNSGALLKEIHNPSSRLISKRIEEFAKEANIKARLINAQCMNSKQLRLAEAYSNILLEPFIFKVFFVYIFLLLIRFIVWAVKTIRG